MGLTSLLSRRCLLTSFALLFVLALWLNISTVVVLKSVAEGGHRLGKAVAEKVLESAEVAMFPGKANDQDELYEKETGTTYREHLEQTTSPSGFTHSPTLGFSKIYVLSLASRQERRDRMKQIARALGITITFVEATPAEAKVVRWIGERAKEMREKKVELLLKMKDRDVEAKGGSNGGAGSVWLMGSTELGLPSGSAKEERWAGRTWVDFLDSLTEEEKQRLAPDDAKFDVSKELYDTKAGDQVTEPVLATWHSHARIWQRMIEEDDRDALILEDDVDVEWDLERMWATAKRRVPQDYDVVYLGHCFGREQTQPMYLHPLLHESTSPRCLHAYAVSRTGAAAIQATLSDPWLAYQAPVDVAMASLIARGALKSYSVQPPLVVQSTELRSDIVKKKEEGSVVRGGGRASSGNQWGGILADSTWARILKDKGQDVAAPVFDASDPSIHFRAGRPLARPQKAPGRPQPVLGDHHQPTLVSSNLNVNAEDSAAQGQPLIAVQRPGVDPQRQVIDDEMDSTPMEGARPERVMMENKFAIRRKKKKQPMRPVLALAAVEEVQPEVVVDESAEVVRTEGGRRVGTGMAPGAKGMARDKVPENEDVWDRAEKKEDVW